MTKPSRPLPILDWKSSHDPRSRAFPIRALLGSHVEPRRRKWKPGTILDQGSEGACVGFGWTGELLASPRRSETRVTAASGNLFALDLYHRAQVLDEWPGEAYSGTSVLAGAKALMEKGLIESYRWCFGIDDVRAAIITEGPVVIGIPWYESMYETEMNGEVVVDGDQVGGHCILVTGYDPSHPDFEGREMYRWRNSWGSAYGINGSGWIDAGDLRDLLADAGEACVPLGRRTVSLA
jgi:hypothetical protein